MSCVYHRSHQADVSDSTLRTALDLGQLPQAVECILDVAANAFVACVDVSVQVHIQVCSHSGGRVRVQIREALLLAVNVPALESRVVTLACACFVICVLFSDYCFMNFLLSHISIS